MKMQTSKEGIDFITKWEGLRLSPYQAPEQVRTDRYTVGVGSTYIPAEFEVEFAFGKKTYENDTIVREFHMLANEEEAKKLLAHVLKTYEGCVEDCVYVPLEQNQFDALVSLCFNIGVNAFMTSTLIKYLNKRNYAAACAQFARWDNLGANELRGLENRRVAEIELFARGLNK